MGVMMKRLFVKWRKFESAEHLKTRVHRRMIAEARAKVWTGVIVRVA
jgi:hypothetical protein